MKRLRNIGIYYTIFGFLLAISFIFFKLWKISILGIILLLIHFILKFGFKKKRIQPKLTRPQLVSLDLFLIISPFLYVILTTGYRNRPYRQIIVLPKNYEGVVAIQYNMPDGQPKKWAGGFLGIGASRYIKVDSTGITKTQFKYHHNAILFLGLGQHYYNTGGLKIYYKNDLGNEIVSGANGKHISYENNDKSKPSIYFTDFSQYPLIIFVITKKENYTNFFMTVQEKIAQYKKIHNKHPEYPARLSNYNGLNNKYKHYYDFNEYYLNK